MHVALWEPEIPPNTGNVARLCAATGTPLHLVGRLGFRLDDRSLRRAGVDYWDAITIHQHATLEELEATCGHQRVFCFTARKGVPYTAIRYEPTDVLLFGSESRGLPEEILDRHAGRIVTIPMPGRVVRSLNLATAVGIVLYEGLRQQQAW